MYFKLTELCDSIPAIGVPQPLQKRGYPQPAARLDRRQQPASDSHLPLQVVLTRVKKE